MLYKEKKMDFQYLKDRTTIKIAIASEIEASTDRFHALMA